MPRGVVSGSARQRLAFSPPSSRQLSTATTSKFSQLRSRPTLRRGPGLTRSSAWSPIVLQSTSRFNSTAAAAVTSAAVPAAEPATSASEFVPESSAADSINDLLASDLPVPDISQIPMEWGYLKQIGLDYGFGPSTMTEWALEMLHMHAGLPWVGSAIALAVITRIALAKSVRDSVIQQGRMAAIKPQLLPLQQKMRETMSTNPAEAQMVRLELKKLYSDNNISLLKPMIPVVVQGVAGFCAFKVLRAMAALPVPGLDTETILWVTDLTVRDPNMILPLAIGTTMYYTFKLNAANSHASGVPGGFMASKILQFVLPTFSVIATSFMPGILQLYFLSSSVFGVGQTYLFTHEKARAVLGMPALPKPPSEAREPRLRLIDVSQRSASADQEPIPAPKISLIDRILAKISNTKSELRKEMEQARSKLDAMARERKGEGNNTHPDGTSKDRLTKSQKQDAAAYEERRRQELAMEREMRNREAEDEFYRRQAEKRAKKERMMK
ncbi:Mitochondrial inner membrane protein oxa1 [Onygenales sp. PD_12]|nr:Mitochondrial inner membrane protein oxa1 [Onygenales sp. PD_12]